MASLVVFSVSSCMLYCCKFCCCCNHNFRLSLRNHAQRTIPTLTLKVTYSPQASSVTETADLSWRNEKQHLLQIFHVIIELIALHDVFRGRFNFAYTNNFASHLRWQLRFDCAQTLLEKIKEPKSYNEGIGNDTHIFQCITWRSSSCVRAKLHVAQQERSVFLAQKTDNADFTLEEA